MESLHGEEVDNLAANVKEVMSQLLSNRRLFKETLFEVENKDRETVPFHLNPIQADMEETSTWRDIYLKPAAVGATTHIIADFLLDNITINGTVSVIISYDEWVAQRQLLKAKKMYWSLYRHMPTVPSLGHKSVYELSFEHPSTNFHSSMYIYSAQSYTLGRGESIHNLLMDEYAFWKAGSHEQVFASAVQRVPLRTNTKVRILSTPNGQDNPFYDVWIAAKEGYSAGKSIFKPHFYAWWRHPEYSMEYDSPFVLPGDDSVMLANLDPDEVRILTILERLGISETEAHNKLRWRRYKFSEMLSLRRSGETLLTFAQEFPEDDESCFLSAGDMAYDSTIVDSGVRQCYPAPIHRAMIAKNGLSAGVDVWVDKEPTGAYIIGIDPGKGKTSESVAHVWTFKEGYTGADGNEIPPAFIHCATMAGYYDEDIMAEFCMELGRYYNEATLAPEDNLDIVSHLKSYPNLYYREDVRSGKIGRVVGWQTNTSTKPYMITEVNRNLEFIQCYDRRFWSQLRNVRRDSGSRSGIIVIGSDDHHDAGAITIACRTALPVSRGFVGTYGWDSGWGR